MKDPMPSWGDLARRIDRSMAFSQSSHPPAVSASNSGSPSSLLPAWILLDQEAYIDDEGRENGTTAVARTSSGDSVKVSFFAAPPPLLSHFCVHCPGLTEFDYIGRPCILFSVEDLALIRITFACGPEREYFFYRAGRGRRRRPSLQHLSDIGSYLSNVPFVASIGFLPHGCEGDDFVLAALGFTLVAGQYELHVFRSERGTWTSNAVLLGSHRVTNIDKVITLGGGKLGFVDLRKGILVCNVIRENPTTCFIPSPTLLPNNRSIEQLGSARSFRDVICTNGLIRFVELEECSRCINHEMPQFSNRSNFHDIHIDVSDTNVLHDLDLMADCARETEEDKEREDTYEYLGWRVIVWSRSLSSTYWRKERLFHVDDINGKNPIDIPLLGDLGGRSTLTLALKDLFTSVPTLTTDDSKSLYLISKMKQEDNELLVILIDMEKKTVEEFSPIVTQRPDFSRPTYIPCDLSKYMNLDTGGTEVGGQNATWSVSSTPELSNESANSCIALSDHCPRAQYYSGYYDSGPITPSDSFPCYGDDHQQPAAVQPVLQHSLSPSEETRIGWQNASWSTSSTYQRTKESVGSCSTPNDNHQRGLYYQSISPNTPSSIIPCYDDYRQQQRAAVAYPFLKPSPPSTDETPIGVQNYLLSASSALQPNMESVHSCITFSDHCSHANDSPGTFPCYGNYQQPQQLQEIAHPLCQQSPTCSDVSRTPTLLSASTTQPTWARARARQFPLQPSQERVRHRQFPTQEGVKQFPLQPIQDRQSSLSTLQPSHGRGRGPERKKPGRWTSSLSNQASALTSSHEKQQEEGWHARPPPIWQQQARGGPARALWQQP